MEACSPGYWDTLQFQTFLKIYFNKIQDLLSNNSSLESTQKISFIYLLQKPSSEHFKQIRGQTDKLTDRIRSYL